MTLTPAMLAVINGGASRGRVVRELIKLGVHRDSAEWLAWDGRVITDGWISFAREHLDLKTGELVAQCPQDGCLQEGRIKVYFVRRLVDRNHVTKTIFDCTHHRERTWELTARAREAFERAQKGAQT